MSKNKIICTTNNVEYLTIRKAMCKGARTIEELVEMTGVCTECEGCKKELNRILTSVCGCRNISLKDIVDAVKNGANTIEKVGEVTGAGTTCGVCKMLIENIVEFGR